MIGNAAAPKDVGFEDGAGPGEARRGLYPHTPVTAEELANRDAPNRTGFPEDELEERLGQRLGAIEDKLPQVTQLVGAVSQMGPAIGELQHRVAQLSQQRDFTWLQIERNTRATALDLAIKAAPGGTAESLTALAAAFLAWLKAPPEGMPADWSPEKVN